MTTADFRVCGFLFVKFSKNKGRLPRRYAPRNDGKEGREYPPHYWSVIPSEQSERGNLINNTK